MTKKECIKQARERYQTEDIEIDDNAMVSNAEDGIWVAAWVWMPDLGRIEYHEGPLGSEEGK